MFDEENSTKNNLYRNMIRENMPNILNILLIDRTKSTKHTKKNIIWANNNYMLYGRLYAATDPMRIELITGRMNKIIIPRVFKSRELQKERTKSKAEVFTPFWIVKKQNDEIDKNYQNDDLETYIKRIWLEITCGEAPYMTTPYDTVTGNSISLDRRVGFVDRKLKRINEEIKDKVEWQIWAIEAYKASYGFEWNGDSLLLARENLLSTCIEYYFEKWSEEPPYNFLENIAEIISYNVFQMDGLKYIIPFSEKQEQVFEQMSLFDEFSEKKGEISSGKKVKIMNWKTNKMEFFDKGVN